MPFGLHFPFTHDSEEYRMALALQNYHKKLPATPTQDFFFEQLFLTAQGNRQALVKANDGELKKLLVFAVLGPKYGPKWTSKIKTKDFWTKTNGFFDTHASFASWKQAFLGMFESQDTDVQKENPPAPPQPPLSGPVPAQANVLETSSWWERLSPKTIFLTLEQNRRKLAKGTEEEAVKYVFEKQFKLPPQGWLRVLLQFLFYFTVLPCFSWRSTAKFAEKSTGRRRNLAVLVLTRVELSSSSTKKPMFT